MKKKILCIGIISMFLLMGITTVSAMEMKVDGQETHIGIKEDKPDLIITKIYQVDYNGLLSKHYSASVCVKNIGTAKLEKGEKLIIGLLANEIDAGSSDWTGSLKWEGGLDPDEEMCYTCSWEWGHDMPRRATLKAIVDPDKGIDEVDDTNNEFSVSWPYLRNSHPTNKPIDLLDRILLQLFHRLLVFQ